MFFGHLRLRKISIFSTNNVFKWSNLTFRNQKLHQKLIKLIILGIKSIWKIDLTLQFTELWSSEIHFSCLKDFNFLLCMFYGSCSFRKNMASLHDYMRLRSIEIKNLCVCFILWGLETSSAQQGIRVDFLLPDRGKRWSNNSYRHFISIFI